MKAEWKKAPDFAEYAETLGIETKQIMAVQAGGGRKTTVIYSPDTEDDLDPETPIFAVQVARDVEGILRKTDLPVMLSITWADMQAAIEERLEGLGR